MNNILEKLGLKCPVDEIKGLKDILKAKELYKFLKIQLPDGGLTVLFNAKILLTQRKQWEEMLTQEIENLRCLEYLYDTEQVGIYGFVLASRIDNSKKTIETHTNKSWTEIKRLLEE